MSSHNEPLTGTWTRLLSSDRLRRSSHVLSAIGSDACIFGGERLPRQPVDNKVDALTLSPDAPKLETKSSEPAPSPRVGAAAAALGDRLYLFSGRGGPDMAPIEEEGAVWNFEPTDSKWYKIEPVDKTQPYPQARSYHCAASDGQTCFYMHAGCPATGRLSDFWKFDLFSRSWLQLPDAPGPARGGASLACGTGKVYRMHGFDGKAEQGGSIDIFDLAKVSWSTETYPADNETGPAARSVCALFVITIQGREKLVTLFGERDPSSLGHAGAGKMLGDVWIYDIADKKWTMLTPGGSDEVPEPRGWFAADVVRGKDGKQSIIVHGGLGENNERLGDVWLLRF